MCAEHKKSIVVMLTVALLCQQLLVAVNCQEEESETTQSPEVETTTDSFFETTTSVPPPIIDTLDFKFTYKVDGFKADVNFTLQADGTTYMSMILETDVSAPIVEDFCGGFVKLISPEDQTLCDANLVPGTTVSGDQIANIVKANGNQYGTVGYDMNFFRTHNCLMIISVKPPPPPEPVVAEDEGLETNTQLPSEDDEANVISNDRLPRQLNSPLGNANLGVGESPVEKHQYDVKKIANQVDTASGATLAVTEGIGEESEDDSSNLDDFYDPEDIKEDNNIEVADIGDETDEGDRFEHLLRLGLDEDELVRFRQSSCTSKKVLQKLPVFTAARSQRLTRFGSFVVGSVFGTGSVVYITSFSSASNNAVINFGSAGSFTFNPLANWPLVVLQGSAVLATYGVIIVWALILGAIVWSVSVGQFSGLFSAKRIGYVASELVYAPIERMTHMVHTGIERISDLNRRNTWNRRKPNPYQQRSNAYESTDYDSNYENDYSNSNF